MGLFWKSSHILCVDVGNFFRYNLCTLKRARPIKESEKGGKNAQKTTKNKDTRIYGNDGNAVLRIGSLRLRGTADVRHGTDEICGS